METFDKAFVQVVSMCYCIKVCVKTSVCHVKSFLKKFTCGTVLWQKLIRGLDASQQSKSSLSPTKLCFYLLFVKDEERQKRGFHFSLFYFPLSSVFGGDR